MHRHVKDEVFRKPFPASMIEKFGAHLSKTIFFVCVYEPARPEATAFAANL
jgi:hypothetical protein